LINNQRVSTFVKFHWWPKLGLQSTLRDEVVIIAGVDPDFHSHYMFEAIATGCFSEWELAVQLFTFDISRRNSPGGSLPVLDSAHWPDDPATAAAVQEMEPSPAVLIIGKMNVTLMGRAIGVLVADGSDGSIIKKMEQLSPIPGLSPSSLPLK
jgi:hypothetical protein